MSLEQRHGLLQGAIRKEWSELVGHFLCFGVKGFLNRLEKEGSKVIRVLKNP